MVEYVGGRSVINRALSTFVLFIILESWAKKHASCFLMIHVLNARTADTAIFVVIVNWEVNPNISLHKHHPYRCLVDEKIH